MILTVTFILSLVLGVPILAVMGVSCVVPMLLDGRIPLTMIAQTLYTGVDQFPLIAVTGFILAGALMEGAGITDRIVDCALRLVGNLTGGLAIVTIMACMFFSAISGSGPATTAAVGGLMLPGMLKRGYGRGFAAAVASSGGTMGILIPPSNPMIIYGVVANVSIAKMFIAGFLPGLLVGGLMALTAYLISSRRGYTGIEEKFSLKETARTFWEGKWALLSPIIILGGIYGGVFTPVEAAEVAVLYAVFVGLFIHRTLTWKMIYRALVNTAIMTGTIIVIVGVALSFGRLLTLYKVPVTVATAMTTVSDNPYVILYLIVALLIFIGMFMETLAQIIVLTPVFLPLMLKLGVDPIQFGIIFVICCEMGFLTPPVGANLYVSMKLVDVSLETVSREAIPFLLALLAAVSLVIFFPQISLFLPQVLM